MRKSTHSPEYQAILKMLVAMRQEAGLTQRDLAAKLKRERSFVWRIETGERRLDLVEFYWVCEALGQEALPIYGKLVASFKAAGIAEPATTSGAKKKASAKPKR